MPPQPLRSSVERNQQNGLTGHNEKPREHIQWLLCVVPQGLKANLIPVAQSHELIQFYFPLENYGCALRN